LNFSTRISTLSHKTTSLNRFYCCFCFCFLFFSCLFPSRQHSKRAFFGFEICLYINLGLLSFTRADKPLSEIASLLVASEPLVRSLDGFDHSTAAGSGTSASVFFRMHFGQHLQGLFNQQLAVHLHLHCFFFPSSLTSFVYHFLFLGQR
jgi:hypothetical protein